MNEAAPSPEPEAHPHAKDLATIERAFELGDYATVRSVGRALVTSSNDTVALRAKDLVTRTSVDPVQIVAILACLAFFAAITYGYVLR